MSTLKRIAPVFRGQGAEEVVFGHVARSKTDGGSALESDALHRMALSLGRVGEIAEITPLTGGLECETSAFIYCGQRFVVKRFKSGEHYPAMTEFENLSRVSRVNVSTPEPVSLDDNGVWFGAPAFVMTALPGRSGFALRDVHAWTSGAATALATIHDFAPDVAGAAVLPRWRRWQPTTEGLGSDSVRAGNALSALYSVAADAPVVFSHDDYNPGNVLFCNDSLSGVIDWSEVTVEPRQAAVALYRHMLAIHPGGIAPDLFLASYQAAAGMELDNVPLWDILYGLRGSRPVPHWVRAFRAHGVPVTGEVIKARSLRWIRQALTRVERQGPSVSRL
jgi:aminoglycoside phosphotransferase (APT) family kinase protein